MAKELFSSSDLSRLLEIITTVANDAECTPSEAIRRMGDILDTEARDQSVAERACLADLAARWRQIRLRRNEWLGAPLFKDPAWDMLLELFAAHEQARDVSVSSLCYASGVPATTALRYLERMEEHGLITREGDPGDTRRWHIRPTQKAIDGFVQSALQLVKQVQAVDGLTRAGEGLKEPANEPEEGPEQRRSEG